MTFFLVALGARLGYIAHLPPSLSFFESTTGLGVMLGLIVLEGWLEKDDDIQELLAIAKYGVHGSGGMLVSYVLVDQLQLPLAGWPVILIGAAVSVATHGFRMQLHGMLRGIGTGLLSPRQWLLWLEGGGVLGVCVAALLAPWLALTMVGLGALGGVAAWVVGRKIERRKRRACPACGHLAREEARRCPECRAEIPIQETLAWEDDWIAPRSAASASGASSTTS
jgi:hypothetical protein